MNAPQMLPNQLVAPDTEALPAYLPIAGFGVLPVQAFVIRSREPVLVDTGLAGIRDEFLDALSRAIAPEDLRWIWITHTDPDHVGNLEAVLELAPQARVVTTFLGLGKLGLLGIQPERVHLLNPGEELELGDRQLAALVPPTFDAPETTGFFDNKTRTYFPADAFGALLTAPVESAADIPPDTLRDGLITWARVDAPWLGTVDTDTFGKSLDAVRGWEPSTVLSNHLPPASGMTETLLEQLALAPGAPPFLGPNQAALETMMAGAAS